MAKKEKTVSSKVAFWLNQIEAYEKQFGAWEKRGKEIIKRYRDERKDAARAVSKFNILWSNVQTLAPAMYASPPTPNVDRRFQDDDDLGRYSALVLERASSFYVKDDNFDKIMKQVVLDRLLPGRGTAWVRYCPVFEEKQQVTDDTELYEGDGVDELKSEDVVIDYVHWRDFGHTWARTWQEVRAVWRIVYMGRADLVKRFGEKLGNKIPLDTEVKNKEGATTESGRKATIYEIWDSAKKQVLWVHKSYEDVIEEREDPLKLRKFFPCPEPLYATMTNDDLIPSPDYTQYQDQALELDFLTARISVILKAVKVAGVYDASAEGIDRLLSEGVENKLIPVQQWAVLGGGKGLQNVVSFFPLQEVVATLSSLYDARDRVKQDLYEITGISDIVRGATNPNETLGAQELKGKFASLRLDDKQKDVARFGRDLVVMIVEIIATHFSLDTIKQVSGIKLLTAEEKQQIQQQMAVQARAAQMQAQQVAQSGQPQQPPQAPELPEEISELMEMPTWEEVDQLIRNNTARSFRIDIETDSTIKVDQEAEKKSRTEFLGAVSGFLQQAAATPKELQPLVMQMLLFGVRGFKVSRELETAFEAAMDKTRKASKDEQPEQDPEMMKVQQEMQLEATKMQQQMELEKQKAAMSIEAEKLKAQTQLQIAQIKAQASLQVEGMKAEIAKDIESTKLFSDAALEDRRIRSQEKIARINALNVSEEQKDSLEMEEDSFEPKKVITNAEVLDALQSVVVKVLEDTKQAQLAPKRVVRDEFGKIIGVEVIQ